jgi:hypothetical protein
MIWAAYLCRCLFLYALANTAKRNKENYIVIKKEKGIPNCFTRSLTTVEGVNTKSSMSFAMPSPIR